MAGRKLAFMRHAGSGATIWDGARYITPGPSRTMQLHDTPQNVWDSEITKKTQDGTSVSPAHYDAVPTVPVSQPVMGSYFLSDPLIFQSYFKVRWEDLHGARANLAEGTRSLTPLANPFAPGRAEGQPIQPYNPWPSNSQLSPQYPFTEGKAI